MKPDYDRIESKSRKSVRSPVANICDHYPNRIIPAFTAALADVLSRTSNIKTDSFSKQDIEAINKLKDEKFSTWDWIHARSPAYTLTKRRQLNGREVHIKLSVKDGVIHSLNLDSNGNRENEWAEIEKILLRVKLREDDISQALDSLGLHHSDTSLPALQLVRALIN